LIPFEFRFVALPLHGRQHAIFSCERRLSEIDFDAARAAIDVRAECAIRPNSRVSPRELTKQAISKRTSDDFGVSGFGMLKKAANDRRTALEAEESAIH